MPSSSGICPPRSRYDRPLLHTPPARALQSRLALFGFDSDCSLFVIQSRPQDNIPGYSQAKSGRFTAQIFVAVYFRCGSPAGAAVADLLSPAYHSDGSSLGRSLVCHSRAWLPREESRSFFPSWHWFWDSSRAPDTRAGMTYTTAPLQLCFAGLNRSFNT